MAFAHARAGDAYKLWLGPHFFDRAATGVAHRCANSANQLVHNRGQIPFVGNTTLNAFRYEFFKLLGRVLKIAIG